MLVNGCNPRYHVPPLDKELYLAHVGLGPDGEPQGGRLETHGDCCIDIGWDIVAYALTMLHMVCMSLQHADQMIQNAISAAIIGWH
eukprot:323767-Amphidinium_carterae.2